MNYKVREYDPADLKALHKGFVSAFSDYFVTFQPSQPQFERRIVNKLNIMPKYSLLAWKDGKVASFAMHTVNTYQGVLTLYNGGTGTVLGSRKKHLATRLLQQTADKGKADHVDRILLEVIEINNAGINLYNQLGYRQTRVLKCFKLNKTTIAKTPAEMKISNSLKKAYEHHLDFEPSFIDSTQQLKFNLINETILEAHLHGELAGHIIFQPRLGRISQLAVARKYRGKGISRALINEAIKRSSNEELTIMNIPEKETDTIRALERLGFENELNQIEMELKLKR